MFRRPFARPLRRALRQEVHPLLRRANDLLAGGQYEQAAQAFEQLAHGARQRALPHDARLFLQAGHCRLQAGQTVLAMTDFRQGLAILAEHGRPLHLQRAAHRILAELDQRGLTAESQEISAFLAGHLPEGLPEGVSSAPQAGQKPLLPTTCPACGAPLRSDEVEWIDQATAECPFCGGALRAG